MDVDNNKAAQILKVEWEYVTSHPNEQFLASKYFFQKQAIRAILRGEQVTYRYILFTAALAKSENSSVHYRALQKGSKLQGAYDARSVAHGVIVSFEKANGERLGGSNEPYLNRPARYPEFDLVNRDRNHAAQKQLFDLLEFAENESKQNAAFPLLFLREVLKELSSIPSSKHEFILPPVQFSLEKTFGLLRTYLSVSGSGERLAAVSASVFASLHRNDSCLSIVAYPVNWSDKFSKTAGDIEFRINSIVKKAAESKDKPLTLNDVMHVATKAKENHLTEYIIITGAGVVTSDEEAIKEFVFEKVKEGLNINLIDFPQSLRPLLISMGEEGRKFLVEKVGQFLNEMKVSRDSKEAWEQLLKTI